MELLQKLISKEEEANSLRQELADCNRKLTQSDTHPEMQELVHQNVELRNVVQELKNAAIQAITQKDS